MTKQFALKRIALLQNFKNKVLRKQRKEKKQMNMNDKYFAESPPRKQRGRRIQLIVLLLLLLAALGTITCVHCPDLSNEPVVTVVTVKKA